MAEQASASGKTLGRLLWQVLYQKPAWSRSFNGSSSGSSSAVKNKKTGHVITDTVSKYVMMKSNTGPAS